MGTVLKNNLIGSRFKTYEVIAESPVRAKSGNRRWICRCLECARQATHVDGNLKNGSIRCECQYLPDGEQAFRELYRDYKYSAKKRGYDFELDREIAFRKLVTGNCYYCGVPPSQITTRKGDSFIYNGIDRVDNNLGYTLDNVVTCCDKCNKAKHTMGQQEFLDWVSCVYRYRVLSI